MLLVAWARWNAERDWSYTDFKRASDDLNMAPQDFAVPDDDASILVAVRTSQSPPEQFGGRIVTASGLVLAARFPDGAPFADGEAVMLLSGNLGDRKVARAQWIRTQGDVAVFRLKAPFKPFDARKDGRIPAELRAEVRSVVGGSRQSGLILDVSNGGLAVAVSSRPGGKAIQVVVGANGYSATLPCEMMGATTQDEYTILHLRFDALSLSQQAFVRQMVQAALIAITPDAQRLAS